jgi:O-antigen/teichoic acid export membrane protein
MDWRRLATSIRAERVLLHNLIVAAGTMAAGTLGVAFQSVMSHSLQPAEFGEVFAVVTFISIVGLPAAAFTLLMARQRSRDLALGDYAPSATLLTRGNRTLILIGSGLGATLALGSPFLARALNLPPALLLAAAIGLPFSFALPLLIGALQGEQRFLAFSSLLVGQAALKLVAALLLGARWGPFGVIAGLSLASAAAYFLALGLLRGNRRLTTAPDWWRPAVTYLAIVVPSTMSLAVLFGSDVLIVKHYFPILAAGEYASVAALGRAIFWGASGVAAVLFPKVIFRGTRGRGGVQLVGVSMMLVAAGGLGGLALLSIMSRWLLTAFAGPNYATASVYLPWYAVGMTLLGGVAVLIAAHQSRGKAGFLTILLPLTVLEPSALIAFHHSLAQVILVMDICMALTLAALGTLYLVQERSFVAATAEPIVVSPSPMQAASFGVDR